MTLPGRATATSHLLRMLLLIRSVTGLAPASIMQYAYAHYIYAFAP